LARSSKRKNRRVMSAFLFLLAAGSIAFAVTKIRQGEVLIGVQFGAWAFLPLALLLGFTLPVQCPGLKQPGALRAGTRLTDCCSVATRPLRIRLISSRHDCICKAMRRRRYGTRNRVLTLPSCITLRLGRHL